MAMRPGTFDDVLDLEEKFYDGGYRQGVEDGVKAGRIEGRTFGLEKGFEKYLESGKLYGRSIVWANRLPQPQSTNSTPQPPQPEGESPQAPNNLPRLPENQRLAKHIRVLNALAESESLSTENSEEAVSDFDDRLKRALGKAKVIERMIGESRVDMEGKDRGTVEDKGSIEDVS